jgi:hypothetical protein
MPVGAVSVGLVVDPKGGSSAEDWPTELVAFDSVFFFENWVFLFIGQGKSEGLA